MRTTALALALPLAAAAALANQASAFLAAPAPASASAARRGAALAMRADGAADAGARRAVGAVAAAVATLVGGLVVGPVPDALADGSTEKFSLPPINYSQKDRCSFKSSTIGQANAARDKLYDLRECDMR